VLIAGALQAGSHILEPLPPRVTRSVHWIAPAKYLLGRPGHRNPAGTVARRAAQLAAQAIFGTVDEIVASPRLLPVHLLELLFLFGHHPARRAAWRALSAQAIASGNPALDYIGTGGPTPLRTSPTAALTGIRLPGAIPRRPAARLRAAAPRLLLSRWDPRRADETGCIPGVSGAPSTTWLMACQGRLLVPAIR
jgi:hypothetical protein